MTPRAVAVALALALALAAAPAASGLSFSDGHGIHVVSTRTLDARLLGLTVSTPALDGPAEIRILLPSGYGSHRRRHYPVLYLLHGTSGGAADWTTIGDARRTTVGRPLIVVMPDIAQHDNGGGWCTDWYNAGTHGRPRWETFHIDQLIPWVDANLRTIARRAGRAIAGLSQGGFCSMSYAARHPDLFSEALSFSGAPDTAFDARAQALVTPIITLTETALDGVAPFSMFGPRQTQEINWAAHDPATLAGNLRGMRLAIYTGDGRPGPFDPPVPIALAGAVESGVAQLSTLFHARLQRLGIASTFDAYGPGTHSWPYWARDLRWSIGPIMAAFAHPRPAPSPLTYTSAETTYSVFGWRVATHRRVREFSTLRDAGPAGFTVQGSGGATVTTPPGYRRSRATYRVTVHAPGATAVRGVRSDGQGRLTITVALGPSDRVQEYPGGGPAVGTTVRTTRISVPRTQVPHSGQGRRGVGRDS